MPGNVDYNKMTMAQMRVLLTENNVAPPGQPMKKAELVKYCEENISDGGPRTPAAALIPSPYRQHGFREPSTVKVAGCNWKNKNETRWKVETFNMNVEIEF